MVDERDEAKKTPTDVVRQQEVFSLDMPCHGVKPGLPVIRPLPNGFGHGSTLILSLRVAPDAERFSLNFHLGRVEESADIALHFNPRLKTTNQVVLNHRKNGEWGMEEKKPVIVIMPDGTANKAFSADRSVQLTIRSELNHFQVGVAFLSKKGLYSVQ